MMIAAMFAIVSCSKEQASDAIKGVQNTNGATYKYTFTSDFGPADDETKMTVGTYSPEGTPAQWETNDAIQVCTTDGTSTGTSTVEEGGSQFGKFTISTTAQPGSKVRVLYPSTATYGSGKLPAEQTIKSATAGALTYTHAYSDEITLPSAGSDVNFGLKHALATVMVKFVADPTEPAFEGWVPASQGYLSYVMIRTVDSPLSGDYTVDYDSGIVTPGANTNDYVNLNRGSAGFNTTAANKAYCTTFPTNGVKQIEVRITVSKGGNKYIIPVLFKGEIKAGQLNVFDLGSVSMKKSYLSTQNDYYAKWLCGEDIIIGDLTVNKTNFPTATLVKASDLSLIDGGLVFIDDKSAVAELDKELSTSQRLVAENAEGVVIGRWKDAGVQPTIKTTELRVNKNDFSMLNVKLVSMRAAKGNVFGKQNAATNDTQLRLVDSYVDARNTMYFIDLCPGATTTNKTYKTVYVDNCIIDLPVNASAEAGTSGINGCALVYQGKTSDQNCVEKTVTFKNSVLFASTPSLFSTTAPVAYIMYPSSKDYSNTNFCFEHNTICNIQNNYGYVRILKSKIKSFTWNYNLGFNEGTAASTNETSMLRNDTTNPGNTFTVTPAIDYNFAARNPGSSTAKAYRINHASHKFVDGYGANNKDTAKTSAEGGTSDIHEVFSAKDYSCGYFVVDQAKVTNGAGALTEKKFVTPTL